MNTQGEVRSDKGNLAAGPLAWEAARGRGGEDSGPQCERIVKAEGGGSLGSSLLSQVNIPKCSLTGALENGGSQDPLRALMKASL